MNNKQWSYNGSIIVIFLLIFLMKVCKDRISYELSNMDSWGLGYTFVFLLSIVVIMSFSSIVFLLVRFIRKNRVKDK